MKDRAVPTEGKRRPSRYDGENRRGFFRDQLRALMYYGAKCLKVSIVVLMIFACFAKFIVMHPRSFFVAVKSFVMLWRETDFLTALTLIILDHSKNTIWTVRHYFR